MNEGTASGIWAGSFKAFPSILELVNKPWKTVLTWQERARTRATLARLDEHILRDVGLSRFDVWLECSKPFWEE